MSAYFVVGSTAGEFEDKYDTLIKVFTSEEKATEFLNALIEADKRDEWGEPVYHWVTEVESGD